MDGRLPNSRRVLILANGERPSIDLLRRLRDNADMFIAADGAVNDLVGSSLLPDVVIGDFDSLALDVRDRLPNVEFIQAPDQNASDLEKAIEHALSAGAESLMIAGATGGRIDHTLVTFSLLAKYCERIDLRTVTDTEEIRAVIGDAEFSGRPGDTLSLIEFGGAPRVTLTGVKWTLNDERLLIGSRGVSNVLTHRTAKLHVVDGTVMVVLTRHART